MRLLLFSVVLAIAGGVSAVAQTASDSVPIALNRDVHAAAAVSGTRGDSVYFKRLIGYYKVWGRLIPRGGRLQVAGNMGLVSTGPVWVYGKRHWETALMFGWVPKHDARHGMATMTIKEDYIPWSIHLLSGRLDFQPLATGLYFNTVFGGKFWGRQPKHYPNGYYWFSTRFRTSAYLGQRVKWNVPRKRGTFVRGVSLFYEISTCDYYLIQKVRNPHYMSLDRWLALSFGLQIEWM